MLFGTLMGKYLFYCFPKYHKIHQTLNEIQKKCKHIICIFEVITVLGL